MSSRTWGRTATATATLCGNCGAIIAPGDPVVQVTLNAGIYAVKRPRVRCSQCAGEPVPDLPAVVVRSPTTKRMLPLKAIVPTIDFKSRQVGEDDGDAA